MAQTKPLKAFIVDDDPDSLALMTALLEKDGFTIATGSGSSKLLSKIVAEHPDCVLLDLMMPGTDGFALARKIKQNSKLAETKIIIVSAKTYEADRQRAYDCGADGYITKPVAADRFVRFVRRILDDHIELAFWGVRGTLPVPGQDTLKYGGNTNCVSLEMAKGQLFVFDAGTGIKRLSDKLMSEKRSRVQGKIFISHPHWDHINALPFFAPLYVPGNEFEILGTAYGDSSVRHMISAQMDGVYFPIQIKQFGARVYFRDLEESTIDMGDGITVRTKLLNHPGKCLGYRVEYRDRSVCYITDNEIDLEDSEFFNPFFYQNLVRFIHGTDALITDATYTDEEYRSKIGWGHSSIGRVVDLAHDAEAKTLYLYHHDPDQKDRDIDAKFEMANRLLAERQSRTTCVAPVEGQIFKV